jgi:tRNA(Ile)-lysidine synthase
MFREDRLSRQAFLELDPAVKGRVLLRLFGIRGLSYDHKRLSLCLETAEKGSGAVEMCGGLYFKADASSLWLEEKAEETPFFSFVVDLSKGYQSFENGEKRYCLHLYEQTEKFEKIDCNILKKTLDYDKIYGTVLLRQKTDGDTCAPVGRAGSRSLKKLYQDAKIPPGQRRQMAVLADENGILWAEGFGADRRAAVTENTRRILVITVEPILG